MDTFKRRTFERRHEVSVPCAVPIFHLVLADSSPYDYSTRFNAYTPTPLRQCEEALDSLPR